MNSRLLLHRAWIVPLCVACSGAASAQCLMQSFSVVATPQPTLQGDHIASAGDLLVDSSFSSDPLGFPDHVWRRIGGAWTLEATLHPPSTNWQTDEISTDGQSIIVTRDVKPYLYTHDATGWSLQTMLPAAANAVIDGDRIALVTSVGQQPSVLKILRHVNGQWITEGSIVADAGSSMGFTGAVSLHGDLVVAGAYSDSTAGADAGAAYVGRFDGTTWNKEAKLLGAVTWDLFGRGVAIDGDDLLVGASGIVGSAGYVRFFHHEAGTWQEVLTWTDPAADGGTDIGKDVDLHDGLAVVGMRGYDTLQPNDGAVTVFRKLASGWTKVATLTDPTLNVSAQLGWDVALNGETILASARAATGVVLNQGRLDAFGGVPGSSNFTDLGGALAGAGGTPCLVGDGTPTAGATVRFTVAHAPSGAPAWILGGSLVLGLPFKGGVLVPQPELVLPGFAAGAEGLFELAGPWPAYVPPGALVILQAWIADPAAVHGFAASNGLQVTAF